MDSQKLTVAVSIADYCFERTRTIGQMNVALGLIKALASRPDIERLVILKNSTIPAPIKKENIEYIDCDIAIKGKIARIYWDQVGLYQKVKKLGVQWLLLPKGFASFILKPPVKLAAYIHDAVPDYYQTHYPDNFSQLELFYFNTAMKASFKNSSLLFTNSEFVVSEINRLCKKWSVQVSIPVVCLGIGFDRPETIAKTKNGRIFALVSKWRHKRSELLIEYLKRWQTAQRSQNGIDFVGDLPDGLQFPQMDGWKHYTRLPEPEYRTMFNQASTLIYFSEYEGFGMPPVEAAICGVCPLYSNIPALKEVMLGCGFSFDNYDFDDFSKKLNLSLQISIDQIMSWGEILLKFHNWESKARILIDSLKNKPR